jgi:hypothetical protein
VGSLPPLHVNVPLQDYIPPSFPQFKSNFFLCCKTAVIVKKMMTDVGVLLWYWEV